MDWNSTIENRPTVSIAVIRLPARVPVTDHRYGGAIILNPGGPGGSGIAHALKNAKTLRMTVDHDSDPNSIEDVDVSISPKYFDIISFDPRGVNNSTPRLKCFPDAFSRNTWMFQDEAEGFIGSSNNAFENKWARSKALGESCSRFGADQLLEHMNTSPVVADMVAIIEMHGKWREEQATSCLGSQICMDSAKSQLYPELYASEVVQERTRWKIGEEKLMYWGFSYGSILGMTFSAMQPQRVHRVVVDGVVDATDYYRTGWLKNLQDTDAIVVQFCKYCHRSGPDGCAFYTGKSPEDIMDRLDNIMVTIKKDPLAVLATRERGPEIITHSDVLQLIRDAVYDPLERFSLMAELLADISQGNGSAFAHYKQKDRVPVCLTPQCRRDGPYSEACQPTSQRNENEVTAGILCSDGSGDMAAITKQEYKTYIEALRSQSKWLGESWSIIRMACIHWKARPKWRFAGPIAANTSHPILLIGNVLDPVTPLRNAYAMSEKFNGSVVLQQDSEGHCSDSSPSVCTAKHVRRYFQSGVLPKPGTMCEPENRPLIGSTKTKIKGESEEL